MVLRIWHTIYAQMCPLKRGGGSYPRVKNVFVLLIYMLFCDNLITDVVKLIYVYQVVVLSI